LGFFYQHGYDLPGEKPGLGILDEENPETKYTSFLKK
jgi:hypothetical protein